VTLSVSKEAAPYLLPPIIAAFHEAHPEITLNMRSANSTLVAANVGSRRMPLGVSSLCGDVCDSVPLLTENLVVIAPNRPLYDALDTGGVPAVELTRHPFIQREVGSGTREALERYLRAHGLTPEHLLLTAVEHSPEAVKAAVRQGLGIAVMSRRAALDDRAADHIRTCPLVGGLKRTTYLIWRQGDTLDPACRVFADFITEYCQKMPEIAV
jgi:DNA-binding transcriptional LysR family regulator